MDFVNRTSELAALEHWWASGQRLALVYGRRRVGKTALLSRFSDGKATVFHTGARRGERGELQMLSNAVALVAGGRGRRDLAARPYVDWDDALEDLDARAEAVPLLLVLDEYPELAHSTPHLPAILRAFSDRVGGTPHVRIVLCGSAVRSMEALQAEREPLFGRFDLALLVHPFSPHEAALMLDDMTAPDRAVAYGLVGGMPLYLSWWDHGCSIAHNIEALYCTPGGRLLTEADLVLRTEVDTGALAETVLRGIAAGRTTHGELKGLLHTEPTRTLDRLIELRLVERAEPAGSRRSRRPFYRITDPMLSFYLRVVDPHRTEIERGLGSQIAQVVTAGADDHMGPVYEEAFRRHLRYLAQHGALPVPSPVVEIGDWWDRTSQNEIDAVVLAGRDRRPVMVGESKWARTADAGRLVATLRRKVADGLGVDPDSVSYAVCAREQLTSIPNDSVLAYTAVDLFDPLGN